eukprot:GHRQ01031861.1.p1 GENE.GHRQ01031861.1~~GHRQ01031861.1.p1  ORF type:complete len:103 (+),score=14.59 GHRQ01031861.1:581-889(+)
MKCDDMSLILSVSSATAAQAAGAISALHRMPAELAHMLQLQALHSSVVALNVLATCCVRFLAIQQHRCTHSAPRATLRHLLLGRTPASTQPCVAAAAAAGRC